MNMFAGSGTRLLLVAVFAVAAAKIERLPRSKPNRVYRPNMDSARLLKNVMRHEEQWSGVLQERIKLLGDPPYMDRTFTTPRVLLLPVDGAATSETTMYDAREIVATVASRYSTIRSFVEYGAMVVRRALACFSFRHLLFQTHCVAMMMIQKAEPIFVLTAANNLKENSGAYINVLAAVRDNDLEDVLALYWEAVKITQYDSVQHVQGQAYPDKALVTFEELRRGINEYLSSRCQPFATDDDFFRRTGVQIKNPMITDLSLLALVDTESLRGMSSEHAKYMADYAKDLGIVTIPDHQWTQMFFYGGRPKPATNEMDATNPPVTVQDPISET